MATEAEVLDLIVSGKTYEETRQLTGWSRGRIYSLLTKTGQRKTEARIRERKVEREQRQLEFMKIILGQTVKADVLDFLDGLPDDSVDMFVTSVPYNLGKEYGGHPGADVMRAVYFHGWLMQILSEISRALKPGGVMCLQVGTTRDWQDRMLPMDIMLFEDVRRTGLIFQSRVIWEVPHGLTPKNRLSERHETLLIASKGECSFNPNAARVPQKQPDKRAFKGPNKGKLSGHPFGAWPSNVWRIPNVGHNHPEKRWGDHPAQFPVELAKRCVLLYTKAGAIVCDPFCGSGTSQQAAVETGRDFVGADLFYEDLRAKRLAEISPDLVCMLPGVSDESSAIWQAEARRIDMVGSPISQQEEQQLMLQLF